MTVKSKGFLRHVALSVTDPWETAEYYKATVGLEEVAELDGPLAEGVFLTDGVVNLAILHFKDEEAAQGKGVDFVGIHHIGFWVDDIIQSGKQSSGRRRHLDHGRSQQPRRLRGQAHRPVRHHLRHRRARLGRRPEAPG